MFNVINIAIVVSNILITNVNSKCMAANGPSQPQILYSHNTTYSLYKR